MRLQHNKKANHNHFQDLQTTIISHTIIFLSYITVKLLALNKRDSVFLSNILLMLNFPDEQITELFETKMQSPRMVRTEEDFFS